MPPTAAMPPAVPSAAGPTAVPSAATQPVQSMPSQVTGVTQPVRAATSPSPLMSSGPPAGAAAPPAETRGRRRASRSDEEDPLTSAAFSLRSSGPVDGRSSRRSRNVTRDQYDTATTQATPTFSAAETEAANGGYPGGAPSFRPSESPAVGRSPSSYSGASYGDPSSLTQAMNTLPYGENYGYGSGGSPAQPEDPRRPNGARSHAQHSGNGEATRAGRNVYPQDGYQGTGSYPSGGYPGSGSNQTGGYPADGYPTGSYPDAGQQGNGHRNNGHPTGAHHGGAHQSNGYGNRGNGQRAPYDPRDDYRRLTHLVDRAPSPT